MIYLTRYSHISPSWGQLHMVFTRLLVYHSTLTNNSVELTQCFFPMKRQNYCTALIFHTGCWIYNLLHFTVHIGTPWVAVIAELPSKRNESLANLDRNFVCILRSPFIQQNSSMQRLSCEGQIYLAKNGQVRRIPRNVATRNVGVNTTGSMNPYILIATSTYAQVLTQTYSKPCLSRMLGRDVNASSHFDLENSILTGACMWR